MGTVTDLTGRFAAKQAAARAHRARTDASHGYLIVWLGGQTWSGNATDMIRTSRLVAQAHGMATVYPVCDDGTLGDGWTVKGDLDRLAVAA